MAKGGPFGSLPMKMDGLGRLFLVCECDQWVYQTAPRTNIRGDKDRTTSRFTCGSILSRELVEV